MTTMSDDSPAPALRRLATYNLHQGGARLAAAGLLADPQLDLLCLQETRDPAGFPLPAGAVAPGVIWQPVPGKPWGSGLLIRGGTPVPLPLPPDLLGWVAGATIPYWGGARPVQVFSI